MLNTYWVIAIMKAKALYKIDLKLLNGIVKRRNREMPMLNTILLFVIMKAKALYKIDLKLLNGSAKRLNKVLNLQRKFLKDLANGMKIDAKCNSVR